MWGSPATVALREHENFDENTINTQKQTIPHLFQYPPRRVASKMSASKPFTAAPRFENGSSSRIHT